MNFLEKDLEDVLHENISTAEGRELLENRGFAKYSPIKTFRQLRIGNYGIADLVVVERDCECFEITIVELKKEALSVSAFLQALNYVKGIQSYMIQRGFEDLVFKILLVGKSIDTDSSFCFFPEFIKGYNFSFSMMKYCYQLDGITFTEVKGYNLTNKGF